MGMTLGRRAPLWMIATAALVALVGPPAAAPTEIGRPIGTTAAAQSLPAPPGGLTPPDLLAAYDMQPLRDLGLDGSGETIVFLEFDDFDTRDLNAFTSRFGLPPIRPEVRGRAAQGAEGETTMDLEVAHAIAPGARLVVANHISLRRVTDADIARFHQQVLQQNPGAIFSVSIGYGCDKSFDPATAQALAQVYDATAALRIPVFVATGDSGAFSCLESSDDWGQPPTADTVGADLLASLPGVTAVGGTRLSAGPGGAWQQEEVWEEPAATGGTGGGISMYLDMPPWQAGPGVRNQFSNGKRQLPDVAAVADASTGVAVVIGGDWAQGGGTSQAAPIWAGMTALINQYLKRQGLQGVGFMNPALYTIAAGQPYPAFHDITRGTNLVYPATPGYDLATGLGTPDAWNLARDLEAYYRSGGR
jgi:kumamolisin